jgi:hypothetical protein
MTKAKWIFLIVFISLSMLSFDRLMSVSGKSNHHDFSEKVNLALRRTTHHLLKSSGDSTSQIPPVQTINDFTFKVRLNRNFDYDLLPAFLAKSFEIHQIEAVYDVAILNCQNSELALGYNSLDFKKDQNVPCLGRNQTQSCYDLKVTFTKNTPKTAQKPYWLIPFWLLFIGGSFVFWHKKKGVENDTPSTTPKVEPVHLINFGNSSLDFTGQVLFIGNIQHNLTYREAKLLKFFVDNANQLLDRDIILKSVWEDEGVTVGRSLDVFVSRLRKMLSSDSTVQIITLHGVGYKLQV